MSNAVAIREERCRHGSLTVVAVVVIPMLLAGALVYQTNLFQATTSATYDEPLYLDLGLQVYRHGSFRGFIRPMTPPLPILISTWPCALVADLPVPPERAAELHALARRTATLLIGVPLVLLVYGWLARRRGVFAGTVGAALLVFSPNVLAHTAIATTDACFALFALVAVAVLARYHQQPSRIWFVAVAVSIGTALAAKQSAVFLFLVAVVVFAGQMRRDGRLSSWAGVIRLAARSTAVVAIALLTSWAWHGFVCGPLLAPGHGQPAVAKALGPGPWVAPIAAVLESVPVPASVNTLISQVGHSVGGHEAFLLGMRSQGGWWYYFPVTIALKSTPVDLMLLALAAWLCCRGETWRDPTARLWALSGGVFLGFCLLSRLNLGIRYLSVLYPLLVLSVVDGLARTPATISIPSPRAASRGVSCLALASLPFVFLQAASAAAVAPHYLSYFNDFAGGPQQGYRYLVDSNLDWGQDLPALKRQLDALKCRRPVLAYFGGVSPAAYGLDAVKWTDADDRVDGDYFALSVTYLEGIGVPDDAFAGFRELTPAARAGYSIFIYDLRQPATRAALARARQSVYLAGAPARWPPTPPGRSVRRNPRG